jgi:predicted nucleic acid-binding protein
MVVVSNTSPLNYLVLVGCDHLLPALFGNIVVPQAVFDELDSPLAPPAVQRWIAAIPAWVAVSTAPAIPATLAGLGRGEAEAIALALSSGADLVLLDERKGRRAAHDLALSVSGTLGVLDAAAARGLIRYADVLEQLANTTFRLSPKLLQQLRSRS